MPTAFIIFWIILLILTIIIEFATFDLVTIWFSVGAIGGLICAAFELTFLTQFTVFLAISLILLIATRPLTKKFMKSEIVRTNLDRIIGMNAVVTREILPGEIGEVKVEGMFWRAYNPVGEQFNIGEKVYINAITGTRLVVSKIDE